MKIREVKKLLAITIAASMMAPSSVMAAGTEAVPVPAETVSETETGDDVEIPDQEPGEEEGKNPTETPGEDSGEDPGENPDDKTDEEPGESQGMTPEEYEAAHADWALPEGYHYVLQDGFVILDESGLPVIEADEPEDGNKDNEPSEEEPEEKPEQKPEETKTEEKPEEEAPAEQPTTNEELIAMQQIVAAPEIIEDFRFWTVAKKYAFAKEDINILEEQADTARAVGSLPKDGVCYILKDEQNGWLYVESGTVRGFVKAEQVLSGEEADAIVETKIKEAKAEAKKNKKEDAGIAAILSEAEELIPYTENAAFLHTRSTVRQTVAEKDYALCKGDKVNIREGKGTDSRIVGKMTQGALCYILADKEDEWVYVESGDVRGFIKKEFLTLDEEKEENKEKEEKAEGEADAPTLKEQVEATGEDTYATAEELIKPEENAACYYTITSVKSGVPDGEIRNSILEFASQFIGNPYVWGGTSLTEGADCSGFVQSIYAQYGYSLPRTAEEQAQYGTQIPVEDARPGDLIFYAKDGAVYHVVMYAGDGKTVEAMSTARGITQGTVNSANAVWAVRVLDDANSYGFYGSDIGEVNASADQYGQCLGTFRITHYCGGSCCNDQWAGVTSTGAPLVEGDTIAVDPSVIPYGSRVIINGHIFTAVDCGGAIKGNRIDVYVNDHNRANALGVYYTDVFVVK